MTMPDFRAAHHWLRGYSDALGHKPEAPIDPAYTTTYTRGFNRGLKARASIQANV